MLTIYVLQFSETLVNSLKRGAKESLVLCKAVFSARYLVALTLRLWFEYALLLLSLLYTTARLWIPLIPKTNLIGSYEKP